MSKSEQIPIRFPEAFLSFDEIAITASNRAPIAATRHVDHWPYHVFCLIGAPKSGLTTIARAWAEEQGGRYLSAKSFSELPLSELDAAADAALAIDNADSVTDGALLLNLMSASRRLGGRVLLTAHSAPSQWSASSPDLESRLRSAPITELKRPDEELMRARIRRACARAYLKLPPAVEDYLVTRLGLSFAMIEDAVRRLDGAAVSRPLSVPLARDVLTEDNWGE